MSSDKMTDSVRNGIIRKLLKERALKVHDGSISVNFTSMSHDTIEDIWEVLAFHVFPNRETTGPTTHFTYLTGEQLHILKVLIPNGVGTISGYSILTPGTMLMDTGNLNIVEFAVDTVAQAQRLSEFILRLKENRWDVTLHVFINLLGMGLQQCIQLDSKDIIFYMDRPDIMRVAKDMKVEKMRA